MLYESARTRSTRADGYLCRLCSEARAAVRNHCHDHDHDHGLVRGPLCGSSNTYEGKSTAHSFLRNKAGAALHLLECRGCLERRTLPARYHAAPARMHVEATQRHIIRTRRCRHVPWIEHVELAHGAYRFELSCWWHKATWTKDVTVAQTATLLKSSSNRRLPPSRPASSYQPHAARIRTPRSRRDVVPGTRASPDRIGPV
ncbi:endonuclease domain-containing protein [Streptomyces cinereospinus]|uniref:Endonuclease domain-containing protein n=1 Tax=Streptomyces cinereospinus TaxID=285561 RepID=A0ABV5MXX8_9ACTN